MRIKTICAHIGLVTAISIIISLGYYWIYEPISNDYSFTTITKISNEYENPLYFSFNWITEDELQVGKEIELDVEVQGLPYTSNNTAMKPIYLEINEKFLNFWDETSNNPLPTNIILFKQNLENDSFFSDSIKMRFIIPEDISATFCDENIPKCIEIQNIIHPAPHDLSVQVETNRISLGVSLMLALLSSVIIWHKFAYDSN